MERKSQSNVLYMKRERSFFQVMFIAGKTRQDPQKNFYSFLHWFRYRYWIIVWKRRCSFIKIHFWYFYNMPNFFRKKSSSHWEICKAHSGYCILWHWCNRLYSQTFGSLSSLLGGNIQGTLSWTVTRYFKLQMVKFSSSMKYQNLFSSKSFLNTRLLIYFLALIFQPKIFS